MDLEALIEGIVRRVLREELAASRPATAADELVSPAAFARSRSISASTVRKQIRAGELPAIKIGRTVRVRRDAQIGEPVRARPQSSPATPSEVAARILRRGAR